MKLKIVERFRAWRHERQQKTAEEIAGMSASDREAMRAGGEALLEIPDLSTLQQSASPSPLRSWLRRYRAAEAREAAMLRVWLDAAFQDPVLGAESARSTGSWKAASSQTRSIAASRASAAR